MLSLRRSCGLYGVSRQSLYQRRQRQAQQANCAEQVLTHVRRERCRPPRLGTRKLWHKLALRVQGLRYGRDVLSALLREQGVLVVPKRCFLKTTHSHHCFHKHPNLVCDATPPTAPNQRWVSDMTYLPTRQGTVYLSLITDAHSRKIVGART